MELQYGKLVACMTTGSMAVSWSLFGVVVVLLEVGGGSGVSVVHVL